MRRAARSASRRRAAASAASSRSTRARVAATVDRMPPAEYGCPAIRAANSSERSPANTRWVWLSTKPGITQRPPASMRSIGGDAAPLDRDDDAGVDDDRRVADDAERALAERRIVRHEQTDVVDDERHDSRHASRTAWPSSAATSIVTWAPSRTISRPSDHHVRDVGCRAGEHDAVDEIAAPGTPASRTESRPTVTRSASAPVVIEPRRPSRATGAAGRGRVREARPRGACPARRSPSECRARLPALPRTGR